MDIKEFLKLSIMGNTLLFALMASVLLSACGDQGADASPVPAASEVEPASPLSPTTRAEPSPGPATIPSDASVEPLLSGETLARYRALPPEFRTALDAYVWFNVPARLAPAAARDKIDQWGEWALPLENILGDDLAALFRMEARRGGEPPKECYANLLLSGYVYAIQTEASVEGRRELMSFLAFGPHTGDPGEQSTDEQSMRDPREGIVVFLVDHPPPIASIVTATALERLEYIGPHAKQELLHPQTTSPNVSNQGPTDAREVVQWLTLQEMFLLKAKPGSEIPPIEDHLSGEARAKFQSLSGEGKSQARKLYRQHAVYQVVASGAGPIAMEAWDLGGVALYAIAAAGQ